MLLVLLVLMMLFLLLLVLLLGHVRLLSCRLSCNKHLGSTVFEWQRDQSGDQSRRTPEARSTYARVLCLGGHTALTQGAARTQQAGVVAA